jgi:hypothetical protein
MLLKIMGYPTDQLADHFHLLRFHKVHFQPSTFSALFDFTQRTTDRRSEPEELLFEDMLTQRSRNQNDGQNWPTGLALRRVMRGDRPYRLPLAASIKNEYHIFRRCYHVSSSRQSIAALPCRVLFFSHSG